MDNTDIYLVASWIKFFKLIEDRPVDTLFSFNVEQETLEIIPVPDTFVFSDFVNVRRSRQPGDVHVFYSRPSRNLYPFLSCVRPEFPLYLLFPTGLIKVSVNSEDPLPVLVIEATQAPRPVFEMISANLRVTANILLYTFLLQNNN